MNIDDLTLREIKELKSLFNESPSFNKSNHPMLGKRCLIRTYSAGVHIGDVVYINPENSMEVKLENSIRLWKWEDGGLSYLLLLIMVSKEEG